MVWGCGSDDNDEAPSTPTDYVTTQVEQAPEWNIDWSANDTAPDWQEPDPSNYETWAIMMPQLESPLAQYASDDDLMAVFIKDELRGLSHPAKTMQKVEDDKVFFLIKVYGNEIDGSILNLTIKYYCAQLHQLFSLSGENELEPEQVYGVDEDFLLDMTIGSTKYPINSTVKVTFNYNEKSDLTPSVDDIVAIFVGDECRAAYPLYNIPSSSWITAYGRENGEKATVRYYSVNQKRIYTFNQPLTITDEKIEEYTLNF